MRFYREHPDDGLHERTCPRCGKVQRSSAGECCRWCGIDSWDHGPIFLGYDIVDGRRVVREQVLITFGRLGSGY